jgi:predicted HAD superfamily Cof-like phosphohydrolase
VNISVQTTLLGECVFTKVRSCAVGEYGVLCIKREDFSTVNLFAAGEWRAVTMLDEIQEPELPASTPGEMLREFHAMFGYLDDDALRLRLIKEEVKELKEAMENNDIIEIADAVADICYVAIGTAVVKGIPFDKVFAEVHRSNMTKLGADGVPVKRADGKIIKGPSFEPPCLKEILGSAGL